MFYSAIPNRTLDLVTSAPNQVWVGDVTYLKNAQTSGATSPWSWIAIRAASSAGASGPRASSSLTLAALNQALRRRQRTIQGLIFHSDRGSEFAAYAFRTRLAALGITQSMKRPRELGDNAFIESFFHSLKADLDPWPHLRHSTLTCAPRSTPTSAGTTGPASTPDSGTVRLLTMNAAAA